MCVCVRACVRASVCVLRLHSKEFQGTGTMGSEISGSKGQLGAASCPLGLRNLEGQVKARPQKAG